MGERAESVLCGLCGQLKNLIQTRRPALRVLLCFLPHPTPSCCPPTVRFHILVALCILALGFGCEYIVLFLLFVYQLLLPPGTGT